MSLSVRLRKRVNGFTLGVEWKMGNELAVLFGYSGAGKSLTLRMIAGLMEPDEGFIRFNGRVLFESGQGVNIPPQQRSIGYVFQHLALFPHMTVRENILYGARGVGKGELGDRLREIVEKFRLHGLEEKLPGELSGGQKQRVAFARSLIGRPDVLLLDEPFSALDNPLRLEMRDFLKEVRRSFAIPVVLVTHDLVEAYTLADRMVVYSAGAVLQAGSPSEVLSSPASADVHELVRPKGPVVLPPSVLCTPG